ncbi:MAG TPA: nucleotidyl transferase AbiEii/AbiGii toxin family protein [Acidimicrobiales bacterium]|nr:nucleotidyl transferase AbiEii/AbiGii toxin family protein [Acidimicrobiales bacterium]
MKPILDAVVELHDGLEAAGIAHAFGGAFALLWCTGEPRTTVDIDLNVFVPPDEHPRVLAALPVEMEVTEADRKALADDGQGRLHFDRIPVDLFFDTTGFHADLRLHVVHHELGGRSLPFLSCNDLAVFKAFFNRRKDWADLEEMLRAGRLDVAYVTGVLAEYLGLDDERVHTLHALRDEMTGPSS